MRRRKGPDRNVPLPLLKEDRENLACIRFDGSHALACMIHLGKVNGDIANV